MGTSSADFFDDDIACDVRSAYGDYLRDGASGREATKHVLEDWAAEARDVTQDATKVWVALAITQWKYGRLEPRIKAKALKLIKAGGDIEAFPVEYRARRKAALEKIRKQLESQPPPEKRVRVRRLREPLKAIEEHWRRGQVVAYRRKSGHYVLLSTEGVVVHEYAGQCPYFVLLDWQGKKIPSHHTICELGAVKYAFCPHSNKKKDPIPWDRIERLDVTRKPIGYVFTNDVGAYCKDGLHTVCWHELDEFAGNKLGSSA